MEAATECYICGRQDISSDPVPWDGYEYQCPLCGHIKISGSAASEIGNVPKDQRYLISGHTRLQTEKGFGPAIINTGNIEEILSGVYVPQGITDYLDLLLEHLERETKFFGESIHVNPDNDLSVAFCKNTEELKYFFLLMEEFRCIAPSHTPPLDYPFTCHIIAAGWERLDQLKRTGKKYNQAFVAMAFNDEMKEVFEKGISKAIEGTGYQPLKIDLVQHNDKICDQIIAEIKKSHFLVADFTEQRQNVYFEAGFAKGLGIPVIWTCREDQINDAHFDTRQYSHITWKTADELREKLQNRIEATIGRLE